MRKRRARERTREREASVPCCAKNGFARKSVVQMRPHGRVGRSFFGNNGNLSFAADNRNREKSIRGMARQKGAIFSYVSRTRDDRIFMTHPVPVS